MTRSLNINGAARLRRALLVAAACAAHPAFAETSIRPFVEGRLVATSDDVLQLGDYFTRFEAAAGLAAEFDSQRIDGNLNYRVARRYAIDGTVSDKVRHRGAGSVRAEVIRDYLFLNANGSASIISPTFGGLINPDSDDPTEQQAFGITAGPTFRHNFANRLAVNADYRYTVFEAEGESALKIGEPFSLARSFFAGASDVRTHAASASIGNVRRSDRVRAQVRGNYLRDRIEQLDEHYDEKSVVGEVEVGITRFLSLLGSGGYEDIRNELDAVLFDPTTGLPIVDAAGRLQRNPAINRQVNFDFEGPRWDAGFRLSPSPRSGLIIRAGRRFGDFSGQGSAYLQLSSDLTFTAAYRDSIDNFGRLYTGLLSDPITGRVLPVGSRGGGGGQRRGIPVGAGFCAFGFDPSTQFCRFNITQLATSAVFRDRTATLGVQKGNEQFAGDQRFYGTATAFYTRRKFLGDSPLVPSTPLPFVPALYLAGTQDISYGVQARGERLLSGKSYVTADLTAVRNRYALSTASRDVQLAGLFEYETLLSRQINLFGTAFISKRFVNLDDSGSPFLSRIAARQGTQATFSIGVRYLFAPFRGRFTPQTNQTSRLGRQ